MRYPPHVAVGDSHDVLFRIHEPDINLAIWRRPVPVGLVPVVARVASAVPARVFFRTPPDELPPVQAWEAFRHDFRYPELDVADILRRDLYFCFRTFCRAVRPEKVTISWRAEQKNSKSFSLDWHHDTLRFRLICIYFGEPTLWIASRDAIKVGGNTLEYRVRHGATVRTFPHFALCVFKGMHAATVGHPLVHSGPPGTGVRLLGVISSS